MTPNIQHSEKFLRERKMALILPAMLIPLFSLAFFGLGGGKGSGNSSHRIQFGQGLDMTLPAPHFDTKEKATDKMGFYKKADLDSAKLRERMREDPYYSNPVSAPDSVAFQLMPLGGRKAEKFLPLGSPGMTPAELADSQANQVLLQLRRLKQVMGSSGVGSAAPLPVSMSSPERMFRPLIPKDTVPVDPQLEKLSGILDKILRIQRPGETTVGDSVRPGVNPGALTVTAVRGGTGNILTTGNTRDEEGAEDGIMDLDNSTASAVTPENLISAVIDRDEVLTSGATVGLRLTQDADIGGVYIGRNHFLWGKVSVNGERFLVTVNSIRLQNTALPVALEVYDQDGLPGIRIPGSIGRDVSKDAVDESVSGLGVSSLDPLAAQAAGVGLQTAKTLISRKAKVVRGAVPAGYRVFLKNSKSKN